MTYPEKRSIVSIFTNIIFIAAYCIYAYTALQGGSPGLLDDLGHWAVVILIFCGIYIVVRIIIEIIFAIMNTIITGNEEEPGFEDERDKLIELKAEKISSYTAGFGFILGLVSLIMKMLPFYMLNIIFCFCFISEIIKSIAQLAYYRRGV